ncbi:hypothetical protein [Aeromonas australiensis]|nr:hypothetical protein [Aeromonas australiensis]
MRAKNRTWQINNLNNNNGVERVQDNETTAIAPLLCHIAGMQG